MVRSFRGWTIRISLTATFLIAAVLSIYRSRIQIEIRRPPDERQTGREDVTETTNVPDQSRDPDGPRPRSSPDRAPPVSPSAYIHQPRLNCRKPNTYLVYVYSDVRQKLRRELIRKTWARPDRYNDLHINVHVFFVVGTLDHNATTNTRDDVKNVTNTGHNVTNPHDDIERQLLEEIEQYHDILVCDVIDSYRNLTLKGLAALEWINSTCDASKVDFVFKTDDDVYVNLRAVFLLAKEAINSSAHFLCIVNDNSTVRRQGKWAVPEELFQADFYPTYCAGAGYGLTRKGFELLLDSIGDDWRLPIEDAFFTSLAIRRRHPEVDIVYYHINYKQARMTYSENKLEALRRKPWVLSRLVLAHPVSHSEWPKFDAAMTKELEKIAQ